MFRRLRAYFLAGVLVTMPLAVTFALAWWFVGWIDAQILPLLPQRYNPVMLIEYYFGINWGLPGFGLLLSVIILTFVGALTAGFLGRWWVKFGDRLIARVPVLRVVYMAVKQILETIVRDQNNAFQRVVLIEYPRKGLWVIAFVTNEVSGIKEMPKDTLAVFVPTTPNPTSGFVIYVPREDTIESSIAVEDAIKLVISVGMITSKNPEELL